MFLFEIVGIADAVSRSHLTGTRRMPASGGMSRAASEYTRIYLSPRTWANSGYVITVSTGNTAETTIASNLYKQVHDLLTSVLTYSILS